MTEGNRQSEIPQEEIKKLAEEYSSKGVYSIKWHEHPNVDRGAYTHFIAGYSAATGSRQPISQLQQQLKEAKEQIELLRTENTDLLKSLKLFAEDNHRLSFGRDRENERLKAALIQAVENIKHWKSRSLGMAGASKTITEEIWYTYYENAPEMKLIREELKSLE